MQAQDACLAQFKCGHCKMDLFVLLLDIFLKYYLPLTNRQSILISWVPLISSFIRVK